METKMREKRLKSKSETKGKRKIERKQNEEERGNRRIPGQKWRHICEREEQCSCGYLHLLWLGQERGFFLF